MPAPPPLHSSSPPTLPHTTHGRPTPPLPTHPHFHYPRSCALLSRCASGGGSPWDVRAPRSWLTPLPSTARHYAARAHMPFTAHHRSAAHTLHAARRGRLCALRFTFYHGGCGTFTAPPTAGFTHGIPRGAPFTHHTRFTHTHTMAFCTFCALTTLPRAAPAQ